ncbi:MAG: hypothetical protein M3123_05895 [Actinomycetota bacterium]|nr:hypothetical protein [Actinomycetota bacterium]
MSGRVRIALWSRIVLLALYLVGIVIQFLAAGYGFFEGSFDFHEDLGWTAMHAIPLLLLIATLVLWRGGTQLWLALALGVLGLVQPLLAAAEGWLGVFHPLIALVLFLLGQALLRRDLENVRGIPSAPAASKTPASV